ncbi:hypothetical protein [Marimonas arenosa]|uniref:Ni,Fe-hydrogenase III large subunit n=1 Tax=Marimonas arenosa TaxID=1795305 RepID=A0AAE4B404_9RHOB|nr:hypothetical protein [Marimonas arenosa]MDQ2089737.1 hypothetical protein [Marimonas arenosa]
MAKIGITLDIRDGRVRDVSIRARDTGSATLAFTGMSATELPARIGTVYSLCGRAQTIAALGAIETALGFAARPGIAAARDVLRRAETLSQLAMRFALHWPRALGLPPDPALPRACLAAEQALETALFFGSTWRTPGAGQPEADLAQAEQTLEQLEAAVKNFVTNNDLAAAVTDAGLDGFGALPADVAPEGGTFSRRWEAPAVAEMRARHGPGLTARLTAGLTDLAGMVPELRRALSQVVPAAPQQPACLSGHGIAVVETARGPLTHRVEIADGRITAYTIDAPTEKNFRPDGPVSAGLLGARADGLDRAAALHILAVDPCVEFELEVRHA